MPQKEWPQEGDTIWLLDGTGSYTSYFYEYKLWGEELAQGNLFRTKEEAIRERDKRAALHRLKESRRKIVGDWVPERGEDRYWIRAIDRDGHWINDANVHYVTQPDGLYFPDVTSRNQWADENIDDLRIYFAM